MSELVMKMSRIRYVKPEFFLHEGLFDAEAGSGLPIRVAFAGLWTVCDKNGRFEWKPRQMKIKILPYDNVDFAKVLDVLTEIGSIVKYSVDGRDYGYIPSWRKHQAISQSEASTKFSYPAPNGSETVSEPLDEENQENSRLNENVNGNGKNEKEVINGMGMENANGSEKSTRIRNPIPIMHSSFPAEQSNAVHSQSQTTIGPNTDLPVEYDNDGEPKPCYRHTVGTRNGREPQPDCKRCAAVKEYRASHPVQKTQAPTPLPEPRCDLQFSDPWEDLELTPIPTPTTNGNGAALRLAKQLYQVLPSSVQAEAPKTWQKLWAEDFAGLLNVHDEQAIADIIKDLPHSGKAKYIVRGQSFVEMFDDIAKGVAKYRKAVASGRIKEARA
jgi:hypothetical protein